MKIYSCKRLVLAMAIPLLAFSAAANANWILYTDTDLSDTATNPDYSGPSNQNPVTVGAWLQDLIDASTAPTLLGQNDSFSSGSVTGLASSGALYVAFHYGNYLGGGQAEVVWTCTTGCSTLTGYSTEGLSNYRYYGAADVGVPEPATLGLLGLGLAGAGFARRRRA